MKTILAIFLFLSSQAVKADQGTITIGCFELPCSFEAATPEEPVFSIATNDVVRYFSVVSHFADRHHPGQEPVNLRPRCFLSNLAKNPLFEDNVSFREEYGVTNVIIGTNLVQAVCAVLPDLDLRTNLLSGAESFLAEFTPGTIAQQTPERRRRNYRTVLNGCPVPFPEDKSSDAQILSSQLGMAAEFRFVKPCLLELQNVEFCGTNAWGFPIREYSLTAPSYENNIGRIGIVYFDGYWSFLF